MIGPILSRLRGRTAPEEEEPTDGGDPTETPNTVLWQREYVGPVHVAPLVWTLTPPSRPGFWYVRFPGAAEYEAVWVRPDDEYSEGLEWSSAPLPEMRA